MMPLASIASWFVRSTWGRYLLLAVALLAGKRIYDDFKTRQGRAQERARRNVETIKALRRMNDATHSYDPSFRGVADRLQSGTF